MNVYVCACVFMLDFKGFKVTCKPIIINVFFLMPQIDLKI